MIKLADSSELGWRVSNEYERIPIASDSEDEKRMYKAEARANRKMKSEKSRRSSRGRNKPYWGRRQPEATVTSGQTTRAPENRRHGLCFNCSLPGHWAKECPGNKSNNKISTCLFDFTCTGNDNSKVEGSMSINNQVLSENDSQMTILTKQSELSDNCKGKNSSPNMTEDVSNSQCKVSVSTTSPVGRLKQSLHKWEQIEASRYILGVIENGYTLPFKTAPPQVCLRNNKSARENSSFVSQEIATLLSKGVISECEEQPHVVNPLTVAFNKASKPRLVLDCRHINPHLHKFRFKYEDIKIAEAMFERGSYLFTYDLRGAYHHIPIHINSRAYLGFAWQDGEVTRYYVFNVLAFGIATAGHIFSKTVREMVKYWRSLGHRVVMFLDDGIGGNTSYGLALETSRFVRASLIDFGFLLADDKCNWEPAREAVWLGHVLNMSLYKLFITNDRIKRLEIFIDSLLYQVKQSNSGLIKVRAVASAVGQIISLQSVFGKIVRLRTRELYGCILSKASWNAPVKVTQGAINELKFWRENTNPLNQEGKLINEQTICTIKMYSDASSTGYGGYLEEYNAETVHSNELNDTEVNSSEMVHRSGRIPPEVGYLDSVSYADSEPPEVGYIVVPPEVDYIGQLSCVGKESTLKDSSTGENSNFGSSVVGVWNPAEKLKSSTWREAEAVKRVLNSNVSLLRNKKVKILSDNKNVSSVLQIGSRKSDLQAIALDMHELCKREHIEIYPEWIPRGDNILADTLSRCGDSDDWSMKWWVFSMLEVKWGPHTVDRFASHINSKCIRFNSRWWVPGTEAINGLNERWTGENNWLVPPPRLVPSCIVKIQKEEANCTLIVPEWKSAPFWPLLFGKSCNVSEIVRLPRKNVIDVGLGNNGIFGNSNLALIC